MYRGLSAGPEGFLLFGCCHPVTTLSWFYQGAGRPVRDICFRSSLLTRISRLLRGGGAPRSVVFRSHRADCLFREEKLPSLLGRFIEVMSSDLPSSRFLLVYQWEAGFLRGIALRSWLEPRQAFTRTREVVFPITGWAFLSHAGFRRSSLIPSCGCSSCKAVRRPLSFRFTGRQGRASAVAFLTPRRGALPHRVLPKAFQPKVSAERPPFVGLPRGGEFPRNPFSSFADSLCFLSKQQTLEELLP